MAGAASVTVLSALADALQVSADTLLLRAAGVAPREPTEGGPATEEAIRHDPRLDDEQKQALLAVLPRSPDRQPPPSAPERAASQHHAGGNRQGPSTEEGIHHA